MYCLKLTAACSLILFSFMPFNILGQTADFGNFETKKNKAVAELEKFKYQDTARVNALIRVFNKAGFLKEEQQVKPYCDEALAISRKLHYTHGLAECFRFMGNFYKSSLNPSAAQVYFDSVILLSRGSNDTTLLKLRAKAQRWKGMIFKEQENYYEALSYLFEALKYYEHHDYIITLTLYETIGIIYITLNNLEQAAIYAEKNIALAEKKPSTEMRIQAYLLFVDILIQENQLHKALSYLNKVKPYIPDSVSVMFSCGYYEDLGKVHWMLQQYDSSFSCFLQAYNYGRLSGHGFNIGNSLYYLSLNALKLGKNDLAKKYAEENFALAEKTKMKPKEARINALLSLSDYYHAAGNPGKAFELLQKAVNLKDSLLSEKNTKQINTLAAIYENDKKQKEILSLQNEKQIQEAAIQKKSVLNMIFIAVITGLLFFGYLTYINFKSKQKISLQQQQIQHQKITELEKDRQLLTADAMLKGQEEERSRIAKDLHDGLGGLLSGVKLSFINIKEKASLPAAHDDDFDHAVKLLDNTIEELRKVAQNLMPDALIRFGLDEALKEYCTSIQASANIEVIYQQFGNERRLSRQAEINIYRIVQELINNALKHAGAKQIIVQLTKNHNKTGITVEDDGKGFDTKIYGQQSGAGMGNIRHRVNYFKGNLDIASEPGSGTSVHIELMV